MRVISLLQRIDGEPLETQVRNLVGRAPHLTEALLENGMEALLRHAGTLPGSIDAAFAALVGYCSLQHYARAPNSKRTHEEPGGGGARLHAHQHCLSSVVSFSARLLCVDPDNNLCLILPTCCNNKNTSFTTTSTTPRNPPQRDLGLEVTMLSIDPDTGEVRRGVAQFGEVKSAFRAVYDDDPALDAARDAAMAAAAKSPAALGYKM